MTTPFPAGSIITIIPALASMPDCSMSGSPQSGKDARTIATGFRIGLRADEDHPAIRRHHGHLGQLASDDRQIAVMRVSERPGTRTGSGCAKPQNLKAVRPDRRFIVSINFNSQREPAGLHLYVYKIRVGPSLAGFDVHKKFDVGRRDG